jgi:opacity protein-like surface antigen
MQRLAILAMVTGCLLSLPAAAAPVYYDMVFDDASWSGRFVIDDATQTLQNGDRYLYTLISFEITNGIHLFDETDTYGDQDALGAVADFYGGIAFFEYVEDDQSDAIAQAIYGVGGLPSEYRVVDTHISYSVGCPPSCASPDFFYQAVLVPEPGSGVLVGTGLAALTWARRRRVAVER